MLWVLINMKLKELSLLDFLHQFHLSITELFISTVRNSKEEEVLRAVVTGAQKRKVAAVAGKKVSSR